MSIKTSFLTNLESTPGLKQFRLEGCLSYFFFDRSSGDAALIDPHLDLVDSYREYIFEHQLKLKWVLDTHTHADHFSASHLMKSEFEAQIGMSENTRSERVVRKLKGGETIQVGSLSLLVLETPGHTPDSICFYGEGVVFTGDTLFIGSSGRTDFPGASPEEQWESLHKVLNALPDATLVFPGHDYGDQVCSTLEIEKNTNPHLKMGSKSDFVKMKNSESITTTASDIQERVQYNLSFNPKPFGDTVTHVGAVTACGVAPKNTDAIASISVTKYREKIPSKPLASASHSELFIDVREPEEFQEGHIPHTLNIPLSEIGFHFKTLQTAKKVYVSCLSGRRSLLAAKTLNHLGVKQAVNIVGGFQAWQQAGYEVTKG